MSHSNTCNNRQLMTPDWDTDSDSSTDLSVAEPVTRETTKRAVTDVNWSVSVEYQSRISRSSAPRWLRQLEALRKTMHHNKTTRRMHLWPRCSAQVIAYARRVQLCSKRHTRHGYYYSRIIIPIDWWRYNSYRPTSWLSLITGAASAAVAHQVAARAGASLSGAHTFGAYWLILSLLLIALLWANVRQVWFRWQHWLWQLLGSNDISIPLTACIDGIALAAQAIASYQALSVQTKDSVHALSLVGTIIGLHYPWPALS